MKFPFGISAKMVVPFLTTAAIIPVATFIASQQQKSHPANVTPPEIQYVIVNKAASALGSQTCCPWNWINPNGITSAAVDEVAGKIQTFGTDSRKLGMAATIPYLEAPCPTSSCDGNDVKTLQKLFSVSQEKNMPILIKLDGSSWWETRSDLWNWWDPTKPGYNPDNKQNVEWTSWDLNSAIKISWRNWGQQIRVKPAPNLASPKYLAEKQKKLKQLLPLIKNWYDSLPEDKKYLFAGVVLDNELSIGVNHYFYPNGNDYLNKPESQDPHRNIDPSNINLGFAQIGYAALKTYGIKSSGEITRSDLNEAIKKHADFLATTARDEGIPKDKVFIHGLGVITYDPEIFSYTNVITDNASPGWTFLNHAFNPQLAPGLSNALSGNGSPTWGALEWTFQGTGKAAWQQAIENTLNFNKNKLIVLYNWENISNNQDAIDAITTVLGGPITPTPTLSPSPSHSVTPTLSPTSIPIQPSPLVGTLPDDKLICMPQGGILNKYDSDKLSVTNTKKIPIQIWFQKNLCNYTGTPMYNCDNYISSGYDTIQPNQTKEYIQNVPSCMVGQLDISTLDIFSNPENNVGCSLDDGALWGGGLAFVLKTTRGPDCLTPKNTLPKQPSQNNPPQPVDYVTGGFTVFLLIVGLVFGM